MDYDLHLQKLPLPSVERPRTAERSHEGAEALIGSHRLGHRLSANQKPELQNSYRSGPVTEPSGWNRSVETGWRQSKTEPGTSSTNSSSESVVQEEPWQSTQHPSFSASPPGWEIK